MPLSERERKVLVQLEQEFAPASAPSPARRWWRVSPSALCVAAAVALPAGLTMTILSLWLGAPDGVVLAAVGYALIVCSVRVLVDATQSRR